MSTKKLDKSDMLGKSTYEIIVEIQEENKELKEENKFLNEIRIVALENTIKKLEEEIKTLKECNKSQSEVINNVFIPQKERLEEENKNLKSDLANIQCEFGFECDECEFWKREIKKHKPCLIKEEYVFNLCDYDYQILTSTTPQLKIIKKSNKGSSTITIDGFTAIGKTFSSLADEEDLYEDTK